MIFLKIITVCSTKGGVGKTTISYNFGEWLAFNGYKVLFVDLDQQCNLSQLYGLNKQQNNVGNIFDKNAEEPVKIAHTDNKNIDFIPGNENLHNIIRVNETDSNKNMRLYMWFFDNYDTVKVYDYVIIDCHPYFDTLSKNAVVLSDIVFCPITPTEHGYEARFTFKRDLELYRSEAIDFRTRKSYINADVYYIGNMVKHNTESSKKFLEIIKGDSEIIAVLPDRELFNKTTLEHQPLIKMENSGSTKYNRYRTVFKTINEEFTKMKTTVDSVD